MSGFDCLCFYCIFSLGDDEKITRASAWFISHGDEARKYWLNFFS